MKRIIFVIILLCIYLPISAQRKAPQEVQDSFKKMFVDAKKPKFSREKDGSWEVDFKQNNVKSSAKFSQKGEWLETEQNVKFSETPTAVQALIKSKYAGFEIESCEKVNTPQRNFYEISVEKGKQNFELLVSLEGELLEEKKSDDD